MATTKFTIVTGDTSETFSVRPRDILRSEREAKDESPVESTYRLAWYSSKSELPFEEWIDSVDDIIPILPEDQEDGTEDDVPPTTAGSRPSRSARG
jgi:hypothetical protein